VLVWLHGGANTTGAGEFYDPAPLVEAGAVVVTLNYRLGAFGFLAHPALDEEGHPAVNYGVMDQQLALRWVRANVARFGGDPQRVTLFGESSGGLDTLTHLVSPLSAGLFQRAIVQSGAYQLDTPSLAASEARGVAFAARLGCPDQSAECLRAKTTAEVLAHAGVVNTPESAYNHSTVDGQVLPETQRAALRAGRFHRVPVVQGANRHEGRAFIPPTLTAADYPTAVALIAGEAGTRFDQVLATYPLGAFASPFEAASAAYGDAFFACGADAVSRLLSPWVPAYYAYEFADENASPLGATHAAELKYLFDVSLGGSLGGGPGSLPAPSQALARVVRAYWAAFARSGDPNAPALPDDWRPFAADRVQVLSPPPPGGGSATEYATRHHCALWNAP
jgi:para-nitrobenzyl esterase